MSNNPQQQKSVYLSCFPNYTNPTNGTKADDKTIDDVHKSNATTNSQFIKDKKEERTTDGKKEEKKKGKKDEKDKKKRLSNRDASKEIIPIVSPCSDDNKGTTSAEMKEVLKGKSPKLNWAVHSMDKGVTYYSNRFRIEPRSAAVDQTTNAFASSLNTTKNRYPDIVCLDEGRVVLNDGQHGDYIHANWYKTGKAKFILTQGPVTDSVNDFWRMVAQEQVKTVIMLCDYVENDVEKCVSYFPRNGETAKYGEVAVKTNVVSHDHDFLINKLSVHSKEKKWAIRHVQVLAWPDHWVPHAPEIMFKLLKEVKPAIEEVGGPVVIHCSAGVGRTCTLVAVYALLERIEQRGTASGIKILRELRRTRCGAIQRTIQFVYVYIIILHIFCQEGVLSQSDSRVQDFFNKYEKRLAKWKESREKET